MPVTIDWETLIHQNKLVHFLDELVLEKYGCKPVTRYIIIRAFCSPVFILCRLLGESGRQSPLPTFVVGVFANTKKLGEGILWNRFILTKCLSCIL